MASMKKNKRSTLDIYQHWIIHVIGDIYEKNSKLLKGRKSLNSIFRVTGLDIKTIVV